MWPCHLLLLLASDLEASLQALLQDGSLQNTAWAMGVFACVLLTEVVGLPG